MADSVTRAQIRRFDFPASDPVQVDILDTLDRVEADARDEAAARNLLRQAELHAEAFAPAFVERLVADAVAMERGVVLDALRLIADRIAVPATVQLLALAREGLMGNWGIDAAARIFAAHGTAAILDDEPLLLRLVSLAGPSLIRLGPVGKPPQSGPLVRLYEVAPEGVVAKLTQQMGGPHKRQRIRAALAVRALVEAHAEAATALVRPLVTTLLWASSQADEEAGDALAATLGNALRVAPEAVDEVVQAAWEGADAGGRLALLEAYDAATRRRNLLEISTPLANAIVRRAFLALAEPNDAELLRRAGSTLKWVCGYFAQSVQVPFDAFFRILKELCVEAPPTVDGAEAVLGWLAQGTYRGMVRDEVTAAIVCVARQRPHEFAAAVQADWPDAVEGGQLILHLADMVSKLAMHEPLRRELEPFWRALVASSDTQAKVVILANLARQTWPPETPLPAPLKALIINAVAGTNLRMAERAVEAIRRIEVPEERREALALQLGKWAYAAAGYRDINHLARQAIESGLHVAQDLPVRQSVLQLALLAVSRMYLLDAVQVLRLRGELLAHPAWLPTVVALLGAHEDTHYWGLSHDEREHLIRAMSRLAPEVVRPYLDDLVTSAAGAAYRDPDWGWYVADVVCNWGFYDEAVTIARAALVGTPEDARSELSREEAVQALSNFEFEAAMARGDLPGAQRIAAGWGAAIAKAREWEAEHARIIADALRMEE